MRLRCSCRRYVHLCGDSVLQLALEDLSVTIFWQIWNEAEETRLLIPGEVSTAELDQFILRGMGAGARMHDCHHRFAPQSVRNPDYRHFEHAGMQQQHLLDLARIDV